MIMWLLATIVTTTRKHDFSKGQTRLKCPHWPRGIVVLKA
jgi:hypothetical protein